MELNILSCDVTARQSSQSKKPTALISAIDHADIAHLQRVPPTVVWWLTLTYWRKCAIIALIPTHPGRIFHQSDLFPDVEQLRVFLSSDETALLTVTVVKRSRNIHIAHAYAVSPPVHRGLHMSRNHRFEVIRSSANHECSRASPEQRGRASTLSPDDFRPHQLYRAICVCYCWEYRRSVRGRRLY